MAPSGGRTRDYRPPNATEASSMEDKRPGKHHVTQTLRPLLPGMPMCCNVGPPGVAVYARTKPTQNIKLRKNNVSALLELPAISGWAVVGFRGVCAGEGANSIQS